MDYGSRQTGSKAADIVDEYHQYVVPIILGDGLRWLPQNVEVKLELASLNKFENGSVHLQYGKA